MFGFQVVAQTGFTVWLRPTLRRPLRGRLFGWSQKFATVVAGVVQAPRPLLMDPVLAPQNVSCPVEPAVVVVLHSTGEYAVHRQMLTVNYCTNVTDGGQRHYSSTKGALTACETGSTGQCLSRDSEDLTSQIGS